VARVGKCANPECQNLVRHYAKPRNRHKVQEYCSPECHRALTPAMRNFAVQWYGSPGKYTVEDVKAALIQALAAYGGVRRLARGLVPQRPQSTLYTWMDKLDFTMKDVVLFKRQGTLVGQTVGGGLRLPKWRGAVP